MCCDGRTPPAGTSTLPGIDQCVKATPISIICSVPAIFSAGKFAAMHHYSCFIRAKCCLGRCLHIYANNQHASGRKRLHNWLNRTKRMFLLWKFAQTSDEISILCIQFDDFENRYLPLPTSPQPQMSNEQYAMSNMTNPTSELVREKNAEINASNWMFHQNRWIRWIFVCHLAIDPICKT